MSKITKPLKKATDTFTKISEMRDLSKQLSVKSKDEIGNMASHFNILIKSLSDILDNLKMIF